MLCAAVESQVVLNTRLPAGWNGASFGGAFATVIRRNAGVQMTCLHSCL